MKKILIGDLQARYWEVAGYRRSMIHAPWRAIKAL